MQLLKGSNISMCWHKRMNQWFAFFPFDTFVQPHFTNLMPYKIFRYLTYVYNIVF